MQTNHLDRSIVSEPEQTKIPRKTSKTFAELRMADVQGLSFLEIRQATFTTANEAHSQFEHGHRQLALISYTNALIFCRELKKRNDLSCENRVQLNEQVTTLERQCEERINQLRLDLGAVVKHPSTASHEASSAISTVKKDSHKQRKHKHEKLEQPTRVRTTSEIVSPPKTPPASTKFFQPEAAIAAASTQFSTSPKKPSRTCVSCTIERTLDEFEGNYSTKCYHPERTVCNWCVYQNTKYLVEDRTINNGIVTCPEQKCSAIFDFQIVRQVLLSQENNEDLIQRYDQHLTIQHLEQMADFIWCAHGCGSGQLHDFEGFQRSRVVCVKCKQSTCFTHRAVWHGGLTCEEYDQQKHDQSTIDTNRKWIATNTKKCPQCQWNIQKYEGCDHMKCTRCQHQFCWECLADHKGIITLGRSRHKTTCSHYAIDPRRVHVQMFRAARPNPPVRRRACTIQ